MLVSTTWYEVHLIAHIKQGLSLQAVMSHLLSYDTLH